MRVRTEKGFMGHLGPAKEPFEILSLDTVGGFGKSRSTKKYRHLLVDHFIILRGSHTFLRQLPSRVMIL